MGEGAATVAVAESPDAGNVGAELVVYGDEAVLVVGNAGFFEAEVVGVGLAAYGEKDMGTDAVGGIISAVDSCSDVVALRLEVDAFGAGSDLDAFFFEKGPD